MNAKPWAARAAAEALAKAFPIETAEALAIIGQALQGMTNPKPLVYIRPETIRRMTR